MEVYRKYFDEEQPEKITLQETIDKLEGGGYYKPGTVEKLLTQGDRLQNQCGRVLYGLVSCSLLSQSG